MTDSANNPNVKKLENFFRHRPIALLDELRRVLRTSGRTVFRILGRMGYLSSYSHAGKYYTLAKTPSFDADGLWTHWGVLFSIHRTLRNTIVHLVTKARRATLTQGFRIVSGSASMTRSMTLWRHARSAAPRSSGSTFTSALSRRRPKPGLP